MSESALQRRIRQKLQSTVGGYWIKIWSGPYQKKGFPDLLGCVQGRFFALEVKTDTGKATEIQKSTMQDIREAGGVSQIVRTPQEAISLVRASLPKAEGNSRVGVGHRRKK